MPGRIGRRLTSSASRLLLTEIGLTSCIQHDAAGARLTSFLSSGLHGGAAWVHSACKVGAVNSSCTAHSVPPAISNLSAAAGWYAHPQCATGYSQHSSCQLPDNTVPQIPFQQFCSKQLQGQIHPCFVHTSSHSAAQRSLNPTRQRVMHGSRIPTQPQLFSRCVHPLHTCSHLRYSTPLHQQRRSISTLPKPDYRDVLQKEPARHALPPPSHPATEHDMAMQQHATDLIQLLRKHGHLALIAGGWVRDRFIGCRAADIDIATSASVAEMQRALAGWHVHQLHPNTARVSLRQHEFEVTTFKGSKREPSSEAAYLDACKRDFTINSLLYDPIGHEVLDYVGAVEDIHNKVLRMNVSPWHATSKYQHLGNMTVLEEDLVRVLRGVRFMVQFGLSADPATLAHMKECMAKCSCLGPLHLGYLSQPSDLRLTSEARPARVWRELQKISALESKAPGAFPTALRLCQQVGLLPLLFPFLKSSGPASKAWQVQQAMPGGLPLELRILGLADPFSPSVVQEAVDMVIKLRDSIKELQGAARGSSRRPDTQAVQLYSAFVAAVWGLYVKPQTVHREVWVEVLAHKHSQDFIDMMAAWLNEVDVQQHLVGTAEEAAHQPTANHLVGNASGDASRTAGNDGVSSSTASSDDVQEHTATPVQLPTPSAGDDGVAASSSSSSSSGAAGSRNAQQHAEQASPSPMADATFPEGRSSDATTGSSSSSSSNGTQPGGNSTGEDDASSSNGSSSSGNDGTQPAGGKAGGDDASSSGSSSSSTPGGPDSGGSRPSYAKLFVGKMEELRQRWAKEIMQLQLEASPRSRTNEVMDRVVASTHYWERQQ